MSARRSAASRAGKRSAQLDAVDRVRAMWGADLLMVAAVLRETADLLYLPGDPRAAQPVTAGSLNKRRHDLRTLADALDGRHEHA